jgi:phenol hydroxylase P4 protein
MSVTKYADYDFEARDRAEVFEPDQLVYVHFVDSYMFCSPAAFRAPKSMTFGDFLGNLVVPWLSSDPSFDQGALQRATWELMHESYVPQMDVALAAQGVTHKTLLSLRVPI